jgi:hypothetical protein
MWEIEKVDFLILMFDWDTSRLKQSNEIAFFQFKIANFLGNVVYLF